MNAVVILLVGVAILFIAYVTYGKWLAKQWGIDEKRVTPAHEMEDGKEYVPSKAPVLMGHHFSSIAGSGPINGPIQAAVFGWVPVMLWVIIGGVFFGAVHDFGALFASIRHKGQSIGEVIATSIGARAKKLFIIFAYLTLILVVAAFASIVAGTFCKVAPTGQITEAVAAAQTTAHAQTAMISVLFIVIAVVFGFLVYRRNASLGVSTIIGVAAIIACMLIGMKFHPIYLSNTTWMIIVGIYILVASVTPVWILLQPRDYLSSFLLYGMMIVAVVGIVGSHPSLDIPAFTGFKDTIAPTGKSLGYLFPALFVQIACGAISGFHSLVSSGTTSKQLDNERNARPIAYGGMLIECGLALISLCAVGYIWNSYSTGETITPTVVFATGLAKMLQDVCGNSQQVYNIAYSMLTLAVSAFCLTSLDTATRLARYMFQEFWLDKGEKREDAKGYKKVLTNPYVATGITVVLGIALGLTGYAKIWDLFGAANQLLAALGLLAVAAWLGKVGRNNKMFFVPMLFMLVATITSLCFTIKTNILGIVDGGVDGVWYYVRAIIAALLIVLAVILAIDGIATLVKQAKEKRHAEY